MSDDDLDMTEPHPEAPRDEDGNPVHEKTGLRICGLPKKNADENLTPYCRQTGYWVERTGVCRAHRHRFDTDLFSRNSTDDS